MDGLDQRLAIARTLLSPALDVPIPGRALHIPFPDGLTPTPVPFDLAPGIEDPLPQADVVVVTWTVDEQRALADVLTPGRGPMTWYPYARDFEQTYRPLIRHGAPALNHTPPRLASYLPVVVGGLRVLCVKSELHLNQDGVVLAPGVATLPVKDLFKQIIAECAPSVVATIGTSGSVFAEFALGDVVVTRAAKFHCNKEFRNEPFNRQTFRSDWTVPQSHLAVAEELMAPFGEQLTEPPLGPPSARYPFAGALIDPPANTPRIKLEQGARDMPEFHPILTTDYFEYGTSTNHLDTQGAAVEMGDAALGLACSELAAPPNWVVVRNMSDPQINGLLPDSEFHLDPQTMWAVAYYESYGYWTSVCGALATWGILAGLASA